MGVFQMVTAIVVAALIAGLIREWIKAKKNPEIDLSPMEARLNRVETLEERVKVLEAIVTDKGYDLKKEFEKL